jgi:hypothetical protein
MALTTRTIQIQHELAFFLHFCQLTPKLPQYLSKKNRPTVSIKVSQSEFIKSFNLSPFLPMKASHSHFESKPLQLVNKKEEFLRSTGLSKNNFNTFLIMI